jgi:hypothetical protein
MGILKHPCYFGVDETPSSSVAQKLENRFQLVLEIDGLPPRTVIVLAKVLVLEID